VARSLEEIEAREEPLPATPSGHEVDGSRGWLVVIAAAVATFTVFGVAYSFGAFFSVMSEDLGGSKGKTTLLFGIANFVYFVGGIFTGRICDRVGPRPLLAAAAVILAAGLWLTSLVDRLWLGYLTYGLGVGIAVACAYVPMVSSVGAWFAKRRTVAVGIAVAGIGLGNLTASYISPHLIDHWDWRVTYRLYAVLGFGLLVIAFFLAERPPVATAMAAKPTAVLREAARQPSFRLLYLSMFVMSQGLFVPFVFLPSYARDHGISASSASTLVGLVGGASIFGRLVFGSVGGRVGVVRMYQLCVAAMSATLVLWLTSGGSLAVLLVFAVIFGVVYGGFIALAPAVTAHVYGTQGLGAVLGALYTAAGFGGIGLYLAGEHIDATGSYTASIVAALVLAAVSALLLLPLGRYESKA
jgi:MFS family permease